MTQNRAYDYEVGEWVREC